MMPEKSQRPQAPALVDTDDRALFVEPHTADIQDQDAGGPLLQIARRSSSSSNTYGAESGFNHKRVTEVSSIAVESSD